MAHDDLLERIDINRIADDLWHLVNIASPTTQERAAALEFAGMLGEAGADEVEIDASIHDSPCVIARLRGNRPGRTLQLCGHIDTIDIPHAKPQRTPRIIGGRGSADMKCGLASILEIVRILKQADAGFPGEILVTVYGLHEEPGGGTRGIMGPIGRGITGDAAIVFEGASDRAAVCGVGLARWDITITQTGEWCHETKAAPERGELLKTLVRVVEAVGNKHDELQALPNNFPLPRKESVFVGQVHYGDFFNRVPNRCTLQGNRRWHPDHTFEDVYGDMQELLDSVERHPDVSIELSWNFIGHSYEIDPETPIVRSLQRAYEAVEGASLPVSGYPSVCDVQRLVVEAGIPAVHFGPALDPVHAWHTNDEYVELDKLKTATEIQFLTVLDYLGCDTGGTVQNCVEE